MPYWRLSSFYFFFFGSLGALIPYWGLHLKYTGFSPEQIGQLMAILLATKIVSPNVWAWIADHLSRTLPLVRSAAFLAFAIFSLVYFASSYLWVALAMVGFSFFWNAVLPQVETITFHHLGPRAQLYGRIRLWGSLGFILSVLVLGLVIGRYGEASILPAIVLALFALCCSTLVIPEPERTCGVQPALRFRSLIQKPEVLGLLLACLLMQASHAPFYAFFTIYLDEYGYAEEAIGSLWALGVICEIAIFYFMHKVHRYVSLVSALLFSFVVTALRWVLIALFAESVVVVAFAQSLHAITFGVYHASALQLIRKAFPGPYQHRGIALYGSISFGIGGAVGSLYSGYVWAGAGPAMTYFVAAGVAVLAALLVFLVIRPPHQQATMQRARNADAARG